MLVLMNIVWAKYISRLFRRKKSTKKSKKYDKGFFFVKQSMLQVIDFNVEVCNNTYLNLIQGFDTDSNHLKLLILLADNQRKIYIQMS